MPTWQSFVLPLLFPQAALSATSPSLSSTASTRREASKSASRSSHGRSSSLCASPAAGAHGSGGSSCSTSSSSSSFASSSAQFESSVRDKVDSFTLNVVGVCHYHAFLTRSSDGFARLFKNSMALAMKSSAGQLRVPRAMLLVMLLRLINKLKAKVLDLDDKWTSLEQLLGFVRAFVLCQPVHVQHVQHVQHAQPHAAHGPGGGAAVSGAASQSTSPSAAASAAALSCAVLDFGLLRPVSRWKRGLLEDRELIERALALMRQARVYQDVDLSAISPQRAALVKEQVESAQRNFTPASGGSPPSAAAASTSPQHSAAAQASSAAAQHRRGPSTAAGLLSSMAGTLPSAASAASSTRSDLFHPLNRFKLNAASEDLAIDFLTWSVHDRAAFLAIQQQVGLYKDTAVFLSILSSRLPWLQDDQLHAALQSFAHTADKREKVLSAKPLALLERTREDSASAAGVVVSNSSSNSSRRQQARDK